MNTGCYINNLVYHFSASHTLQDNLIILYAQTPTCSKSCSSLNAARPYWVGLTCETSDALHNIALLLGVMCSQNILIYSHTLIIHCIYSDTSAHDPSHMTLHNMPLLHGVCVLRTF